MWNEAVMAQLNVLSWHLLEQTEKEHNRFQSGQFMSQTRFRLGMYRIKSRRSFARMWCYLLL